MPRCNAVWYLGLHSCVMRLSMLGVLLHLACNPCTVYVVHPVLLRIIASHEEQHATLQDRIFLNTGNGTCPEPAQPAACPQCYHFWLAEVYHFKSAEAPWTLWKPTQLMYSKVRCHINSGMYARRPCTAWK
jgi:hypothetical protein